MIFSDFAATNSPQTCPGRCQEPCACTRNPKSPPVPIASRKATTGSSPGTQVPGKTPHENASRKATTGAATAIESCRRVATEFAGMDGTP